MLKLISVLLSLLLNLQIIATVIPENTIDSPLEDLDSHEQMMLEELDVYEVVTFDLDTVSKERVLEKKVIDDNDTIHTFRVEEADQGFSIMSLANKTYTVSHIESGVYEASFKIDINTNRIRRAHSDNIKIFRGSISNRQLSRVSDTRARLSFTHRYLLFTANNAITANVSGGKLSITVSR